MESLSLPSPIHTKRTRTASQSERALLEPVQTGTIDSFCRQKGHGFINPDDCSDPVFLHVSDIDGEYVPHKGDQVEFRKILTPPKNEKFQAVHARIVNFTPERHEKWDEPVPITGSHH